MARMQEGSGREIEGTVVFGIVGRPQFGFDVFSVRLPSSIRDYADPNSKPNFTTDTRLTEAKSVNYNAQFVSESDCKLLSNGILKDSQNSEEVSSDTVISYVSERTGSPRIHFSGFSTPLGQTVSGNPSYFYDRPFVKNGKVFYVSIQEAPGRPFQSSCAVYSTCISTGKTVRLTPPGVADFSPAISPSGEWIAVASHGDREWDLHLSGDLRTDIYIFRARDGSGRTKIAENGGWTTWSDENTLYFHRLCDDKWWSVFKLENLNESQGSSGDAKCSETRITPASLHAFTPCAFLSGEFLALATRRRSSKYRHIEMINVKTGEFIPVTECINPKIHHYSPFVSPDSNSLGFHRFRGLDAPDPAEKFRPYLDPIESPLPTLQLLRIGAAFPTFSPDGSLVAFNTNMGEGEKGALCIVRVDGRGRVWNVFKGPSFSIAWNPNPSFLGLIYSSVGPIFAPDKATVHIVSIKFVPPELRRNNTENLASEVTVLTKDGTQNNAFPSVSPDGKELVFRSGRDGKRNLYVMDALLGEEKGWIRRLTDGPWIDTMPSWSPDGNWIAFSSNRDDAHNKGYFSLYLIHPDGTGLHRVPGLHKERINHVCFSPDSKSLMFTANFDGVSAEPISLPNQFQPYGEIYVMGLDGSDLKRLTFNPYEDGTPSWHCSSINDLHSRLMELQLGDDALGIAAERISGEFDEPLWLVYP
eukprot:TRINITY_DN900_c0_g1_i1.p1 TRINITY_DN900_c0_g1~~TRINITY_DN900_c0_g1_i1.p1  ORF type:complete len:720 (-),score=22.42 TRINITY_DN900_c0_g1_i1:920-3016(-)